MFHHFSSKLQGSAAPRAKPHPALQLLSFLLAVPPLSLACASPKMPGRHQVIYAYKSYGGGTDLWCSSSWYPSGAWFYVWTSPKPLSQWHRTPPWSWAAKGWRFAPEVPWHQLTPMERIYSDINLPPAQAKLWAPPIKGGAKGGAKGGSKGGAKGGTKGGVSKGGCAGGSMATKGGDTAAKGGGKDAKGGRQGGNQAFSMLSANRNYVREHEAMPCKRMSRNHM